MYHCTHYRASWSCEKPADVSVSLITNNVSPERVGYREIEVFGFTEQDAKAKCLRRLAQFQCDPKKFKRT